MILAFTLARRELRGGVRGLWIVLLCLALGVGVIAAVGTLRAAVDAGLSADGRALLGGDLEIDGGSQPLPDRLIDWLHARGAMTSRIVQMRSMLVAPSGERQLIELKAVDGQWPLVGEATAAPAQSIADALGQRDGHFGLLAEQIVLDRLALHAGDTVRLGTANFRVSGALKQEPDRVGTAAILGPRVLVSTDALASTGLISPGAMVRYQVRLTTPDPADIARDIRIAFPGQGWRIRDPSEAAPGVGRFIDRTALFLTLVGLTSLLVGGIGVANGVRAWLDARARTIATLRCLGASARLVFGVCVIQVLTLAAGGIVVGVVAGAALPLAGARLLEPILPVPPVLGFIRTAGSGGPVWVARCALFRALAAGPGGADTGRRTVPGWAGARGDAALGKSDHSEHSGRSRIGWADGADGHRPFLCPIFLCRRRADAGAIPSGRGGGDVGCAGGAGGGVAVDSPRYRQPTSSWGTGAVVVAVWLVWVSRRSPPSR